MIEEIFEEVVKEARNGVVMLKDDGYDMPVRMCFTFDEEIDGVSKINVTDPVMFKKCLKEYVYCALNHYKMLPTEDNVKSILTYVWSNITSKEMLKVENFLEKRIAFFDSEFIKDSINVPCELGEITGIIDTQSLLQETPFCFKSVFHNGEDTYALPRISFGIADGVCYIYAIQNKDCKLNTNNSEYNELVNRTMRSINSGVKKYRNVTPSFVVALTFFTSILKSYGIDKIEVLSPLPIRQDNKKRVNKYIVDYKTMKGDLDPESVEVLKKSLEDKRIMDERNATVKFRDCFNRLKVHFSGIHLESNVLTNDMVLDVLELSTNQPFLQQIVADVPHNVLK